MQLVGFLNSLFKSLPSSYEKLRTNNFLYIITLAHIVLSIGHIGLSIWTELLSPVYFLGIYLALLTFVLFLSYKKFQITAKALFLVSTLSIFASLSSYFGSYHLIQLAYIAIIITPNLLFSFKVKKELLISAFFQLATVILFLQLQYNIRYAQVSLSYHQSNYVEYFIFAYVGLFLAFQIFYLLFTVNKNEQNLKQAIVDIEAYKSALDAACIVSYTNIKGEIVGVNDNFCRITGYDAKEVLGKNHHILKSGFHNDEFYQKLWKTISRGDVWRGEICNKAKNGDLYWVDSSILPMYSDQGIYQYISIQFDITQKRNFEAQIIQSAKMSSLGEMAGGVAHEINTPLSIIHIRSEQLIQDIQNKEKELDREDLLKNVLSIDKTNKRITKIVNSLKSFSRNSSKDEREVALVETIIYDTFDLCDEKLKNVGIDLHYNTDKEYYLNCKPSEISQVLLNLLNNSVDAIKNSKDKWIKVDVKKIDKNIEISVSDSGGGVPETVRDKIFQPFFTTKEVGKGTGLGLSLSKGIAQAHGGDLYLRVENDNSTSFVISIPAISK